MKNRFILKKVDLTFALILIIYTLLGIFLLKYYQYYLSEDGVSYISIAKKYISGDFSNAVNGYWGPLYSWLLIPFLFFGSTPQYAVYSAKIMSLIIGFFTITGVRLLSYRFEMNEEIRIVILFSLIPIVLSFSLSLITPDLLLACVLVYYLNIIFDTKYYDRPFNGLLCGVMGAIAYLSKSFAFPFFISHFFLFNFFHYIENKTKKRKMMVLRNLLLGFIIFLAVSSIWIGTISNKYGKITIGTAGEYNYALVGPESQGHFHFQGFLKPPNKTAISVWEDPSYSKMNSWSPIESWNYFKYQLKLIWENTFYTIVIYHLFSFLSSIIILLCILICIEPFNRIISKKINKKISENVAFYSLITIFLYSAEYTPILVEIRYLLVVYILLILMDGYLLNILFQSYFIKSNLIKKYLLIFFVCSFVLLPVTNLIHDVSSGANPLEELYNLSKTLKSEYDVKGNIASNKYWRETMILSYYLNSRYYGQSRYIDDEDLLNELRRNNIDFYFVWGEKNDRSHFLPYREITDGKIKGLRIYYLKEQI